MTSGIARGMKSKYQSGIALLSIMLVLTLMVVIAAEVTRMFSLQLRRTSTLQDMTQARWYAISAEELGAKVLADDFEDEDDAVVHLGQNWTTANVNFPVDGGMIGGEIEDAQACFNLNALNKEDVEGVTALELRVFQQLLELLDIDSWQAENISQSVRTWINPEDDAGHGAGDSYYQSLPVPYLAGKTAMRDISEFRAVRGVSADIMRRVSPYVCVIPDTELRVNVNTLSPDQAELLSALFLDNLPVEQARDILESRPSDGWDSVDDFFNDPMVANFTVADARQLLTVDSRYFQLNTRAVFSDSEIRLDSLLERVGDNEFSVIRRQFGGLE